MTHPWLTCVVVRGLDPQVFDAWTFHSAAHNMASGFPQSDRENEREREKGREMERETGRTQDGSPVLVT